MITPASKFWKGPAQNPRICYVQARVRNHGPRNDGPGHAWVRRQRQIKAGRLTAANGLK